MTRKKKATPRKPRIQRKAPKRSGAVEGGPKANGDGLIVVGPVVHDEFKKAVAYERARAEYIASHPVQPTQWERLSAWVKDNPIDAGLIAVGFGGAVVLGVMAAL